MMYQRMILIMIAAGFLSSMYIWSDKASDIRLSVNDIYMVALMFCWMVFFMSIFDKKWNYAVLSALGLLIVLVAIRRQALVTPKQFYTGMIPHHSMAVLMSKRLLEKYPDLAEKDKTFVENIIKAQQDEIDWMKQRI